MFVLISANIRRRKLSDGNLIINEVNRTAAILLYDTQMVGSQPVRSVFIPVDRTVKLGEVVK